MPRASLQLLLAIVLGLAASYFWEPLTRPSLDTANISNRQQLPQNYLETTRTWNYDEGGALVEIIEAQRADHFPKKDEALLQEPRYYSHHGDDRTWSGQAKSGRYIFSRETLVLLERVKLVNDQSGGILESESMSLDMDKKTAATIMPVTITQGPHVTRADALLAELDSEKIQLINNVESTYVPDQP